MPISSYSSIQLHGPCLEVVFGQHALDGKAFKLNWSGHRRTLIVQLHKTKREENIWCNLSLVNILVLYAKNLSCKI